MTDEQRFERAARSWLELGPTHAPDRVIRAAFADIERAGQERPVVPDWMPLPSLRPRRGRDRAAVLGLSAGAALLVVAFVLAGIVGGPPRNPVAPSAGPTPTPSASPSASASSPSTKPSAAASPSVAPSQESPSTSIVVEPAPTPAVGKVDLTGEFTSDRYGYSIGIGDGWTSKQATLTWTGPDNTPPVVDEIDIAGTDTDITAASEALKPGQTFAAWLDAFQPPGNQGTCNGGAPNTWPAIQIGGEPGLWQQMCNAAEAIVEHDGRAYVFTWGNGTFDNARHLSVGQFLEVLSSIRFDATSVPPPPIPPPLTQTFTSNRNGFSVRYPDGWRAHRATGPLSRIVAPADDAGWDVLQSPELRLSVASAPLDPGMSEDEWARLFCMWGGTAWSPPCAEVPGAWEQVAIGSGRGWLATNGDSAGEYPTPGSREFAATIVADGRAYQIWLEGPAERELFLEILASMQLDPAAAVDATPKP